MVPWVGVGEEDGDVSKLAEVPAAKKRVVKRPQPKLDSQRCLRRQRFLYIKFIKMRNN